MEKKLLSRKEDKSGIVKILESIKRHPIFIILATIVALLGVFATIISNVSTIANTVRSFNSPSATPIIATPTARLTPTLPVETPGLTPTPIYNFISEGEFPAKADIVGPAIVEWADPGCGIFTLIAGERFNWTDGHYWIYANKASLDHYYSSHLRDYSQKNPSCLEGRPYQKR